MFPPAEVGRQRMTANGREYAATPGEHLDVENIDAGVLEASGWSNIGPCGNERPATAAKGDVFIDTTLGKPVFFDGSGWRDADAKEV